ncbi:hypothetical protein [Paractinoplanes lichenicola]|uniref:Uncharacterized protein n=1 Tax=Paractinoplanes lichenicola TaxID=2802976 RepID=A0ABS1VH20_9ACTN|nr:hypothetical protein [Actinoplanes lichenicola]MBL7254006.1 hypothetical protein [Actinoplanes lichenicola]
MDEPYRPLALRVMAEHDGDGLWDTDREHRGPADLDDLGLSAELAVRLRSWNGQYQRTALTDFEFPSPEAERRWVADGLRLAYELQNELPDIDVSYAHDDDHRPMRERRGP